MYITKFTRITRTVWMDLCQKKMKSVKILKNFTHATVHTSNLFKLFVVFFSLTLGFVGDGFLSFWVLWISFFPVWCLRGRVCLLVVSYNVDTKCLIVSFQSIYRGSINQYNTMVTSCAHSKPEPGISIKFYHCFLCIKVFREFMKNDSCCCVSSFCFGKIVENQLGDGFQISIQKAVQPIPKVAERACPLNRRGCQVIICKAWPQIIHFL
jgi:hypothetical protein